MKHTLIKLTPLLVIFTVLLSSNFINAAFTAPTGTPSAANNAPAPINVSSDAQTKSGALTASQLNSTSRVTAAGQMRSPQYCDQNGANCFTPASVNSSSFRTTRHGYYSFADRTIDIRRDLGKKDFCMLSGVEIRASYKDGDNVSCQVVPTGGGKWMLHFYKQKEMNLLACNAVCIGDGGLGGFMTRIN